MANTIAMRMLFTLLLSLFLSSCNQARIESIRFGLASAPTNLDPRYATDATSERINRLLFCRLVEFNDNSMPIPSMATWQLLSDTHYRFTLGEHCRVFHDGTRVTSADVVATYESVLDSGDDSPPSPHKATLDNIKKFSIIDEDTTDIYLHKPDTLQPAFLTIGILPKSAIDSGEVLSRNPVGSGPFRLKNWPQRGTLTIERIRDQQLFSFEEVRDPTMRVLKLLNAEIDLLQSDLPPELLGHLKKQSDVRVSVRAGSNFSYIGFNLEKGATQDLLIRKAIALSIDRNEIIEAIFQAAARPASAILPPEHWAGTNSLKNIDHNPVKARALLERAGYNQQNPLQVEYKTSSDPFRIRIASVFQQQLAEVGIQLTIKSYDWGTFFGDIKSGNFQMYSLTWVGVKSPDIFRYAFHSDSQPPKGANRGRLSDARVDQLIESASSAMKLEEKSYQYAQLQKHLLDELPYIPLWFEDQFVAVRDDITGYALSSDGDFDALEYTSKQ